jgi:glutathione S-transferase
MKTGNCIRAAMALEEAEMPYLVRRYYPRAPGEGEAEYRQLNPSGKVPTLVDRSQPDDPFVLTQSNAIVLYAAAKAPEKLLQSRDARARARVLERFLYFVTDALPERLVDERLISDTRPRRLRLECSDDLTVDVDSVGRLHDATWLRDGITAVILRV